MKICFCNTIPSWGGGEKWHFEMALAMASTSDNQVTFMSCANSEIDKRLPDAFKLRHYITIGNLSFLNVFKLLKLVRYFRIHDFDAIIINRPAELKLVAPAAKLAGVKKVIYRRGSDVKVKNSFLNRLLLEKVVTHIIANSNATKASLLKTGLKIAEKITIIYNGVKAPSTINPHPKNDPVLIGAVGRLSTQKGFDYLVDIVKRLHDKGIAFKVQIAGEGSEREKLEKLIAEAGLQDQIELVGFINDVYAFLGQCDIFVLPSRYEGFGYVVAEAMFVKKPVVAFNISSVREIIVDNETGFLATAYDLDRFADKVHKLIADQQLRLQMGEKGAERATSHFSFDRSVEQIIQLLHS